MDAKRSVLLVEDHPLVRDGVAALINREDDLAVSAAVASLKEARAALSQQLPDLVITDLTLPDGSGLEFVKDLRCQYGRLPILVLSMHEEMLFATRALRAGATGYLMKDTPGGVLVETIRRVIRGGRGVSGRMASDLLSGLSGRSSLNATSPLAKLTDRELEIFELMGYGKASGEIACCWRGCLGGRVERLPGIPLGTARG